MPSEGGATATVPQDAEHTDGPQLALKDRSGALTPEGWADLRRANEDGFWRLVRFEAEHEPDRLDYYAELDRAEAQRKSEERKRRAALLPPPGPGRLLLDESLERLECVRPAGPNRWRARCPTHGSKQQRSLLVSENEARPGEPVFHCFAGCDWRSIAESLR
jgi:hypothetical protein